MSMLLKSSTSQVAARGATTRAQAAIRPNWLPGSTVPSHLNGTLPGDYGFDPLGLGKDPAALKWFQQAEIIHARTAMTGVAGILIPSALNKLGVTNLPEWWEAGKVSSETTGISLNALIATHFALIHFVEVKRWQDIRKPGSQAEAGSFLGFETAFKGTGQVGYPGGPFDPLNLAGESADKMKDLQLKEIKNGRLAMLAFLGFVSQHAVYGKGPWDDLALHLSNPWQHTFADNGVSVPGL